MPVAKGPMMRRGSGRADAIVPPLIPLIAAFSYCKLRAVTMFRFLGRAGGAVLSVCLVVIVGCSFGKKSDLPYYDAALYAAKTSPAAPAPTPGLFEWAGGSEYAIVVRKQERTLTLYHWTKQQKVYPVVLGIAPSGPKTYQGDLRTPEGVYRIVLKREHERWSRFMLLSYPNDVDRRRYAMELSDGRVPIVDGHEPGLGGAVGIHGTDRES